MKRIKLIPYSNEIYFKFASQNILPGDFNENIWKIGGKFLVEK